LKKNVFGFKYLIRCRCDVPAEAGVWKSVCLFVCNYATCLGQNFDFGV